MLCLIVILSSGRVCCRGPVPEHFGTGEPDHRLLGAVTDRLAFPVVWLEDVSSNGRHFALKKKREEIFRWIHFNEKRIWFFERPIDTSRNEWNWNKWCPWNTRWFILVEWTSGAVGTELATLMADVCFYLKFPSIWWVRVGSYSAV